MHEHYEVLEARYTNLADSNAKRLANRPATVRCRYERDHKAPSVKGEACKLGGTVWGGTYPQPRLNAAWWQAEVTLLQRNGMRS